jgi:hypothetical protein
MLDVNGYIFAEMWNASEIYSVHPQQPKKEPKPRPCDLYEG